MCVCVCVCRQWDSYSKVLNKTTLSYRYGLKRVYLRVLVEGITWYTLPCDDVQIVPQGCCSLWKRPVYVRHWPAILSSHVTCHVMTNNTGVVSPWGHTPDTLLFNQMTAAHHTHLIHISYNGGGGIYQHFGVCSRVMLSNGCLTVYKTTCLTNQQGAVWK